MARYIDKDALVAEMKKLIILNILNTLGPLSEYVRSYLGYKKI